MTFKFTCGVHPSHYKAYNFHDHIWHFTKRHELLEMTDYVIAVGKSEEYYVRLETGAWTVMGRVAARKHVENTMLGRQMPSGRIVTAEMIKIFFTGKETQSVVGGDGKAKDIEVPVGSSPILQGTTVMPMCPTFIEVDGIHYLNLWRNQMVIGDPDCFDQSCLLLLVLVYGSLCSGPMEEGKSLMEMAEILLDEVLRGVWRMPEFKFVMMWFAALYQFPGINMQTNLWLTGAAEGVGKGTLFNIMRELLGPSYCATMDQQEIGDRGWSSALRGKQLILADEFDAFDGKVDWGKWIRRNTCETYVDFAERNIGNVKSLNIGNYLFLTNETEPMKISFNDRRNVFIATTNDLTWKVFAKSFNVDHYEAKKDSVNKGWAWLLSEIDIDRKFVNTSLDTERKMAIADASLNGVDQWILNDTRLLGVTMMAREAYDLFKEWASMNGVEDITESAWGRAMRKLDSKGWVKKEKRRMDGQPYTFRKQLEVNVVGAMEDAWLAAKEFAPDAEVTEFAGPRQAEDRRSEALKRMQAALLSASREGDEPFM